MAKARTIHLQFTNKDRLDFLLDTFSSSRGLQYKYSTDEKQSLGF